MRILNFLLVLLAVSPLMAAEIFKWVDADGRVHYGEDPAKGKVIKLPGLTTYSSPPITEFDTSVGTAPPAQESAAAAGVAGSDYKSAIIRSPQKGETIISNTGAINVVVDTKPNLQAGDSIKAYLDGRLHGGSQFSNAFELSGISGGSHQLRAVVFDKDGVVKQRASSVSFALRNFSVETTKAIPTHQVIDDTQR